MNLNFNNTQHNGSPNEISAQARYLMNAERQRAKQRRQAMLHGVTEELKSLLNQGHSS